MKDTAAPPIKTTAKYNTTTDSTHEHPKYKKNARSIATARYLKIRRITDEDKKPTHARHFCISFFVFICRLLRFDCKRNCFLSVSLLCYKFCTCVNEKVCLCACVHASVCIKIHGERKNEWEKWKELREKKQNKFNNALLTLFSLTPIVTDSICMWRVFLEMLV